LSFLEVKNLVKNYERKKGIFTSAKRKIHAVDDVSISMEKGETLGLVGESGCGKSTLGRLIVRLEEPTYGKILFDGVEITGLKGRTLRNQRRRFQIIFQDSFSSLNPRMTVGTIIEEPLANFGTEREKRRERVGELLMLVGLEAEHAFQYPHEFSGGQRQRINIARALALQPEFIVCDEPVSSLDVSIRAQILNLFRDLKKRLGLSYLFISHDLAAVTYLSDRVAVMYLGKIVEILPAKDLESKAYHLYTIALLNAIMEPDPKQKTTQKQLLKGEPPDAAKPPTGCRFHPRCSKAKEVCRQYEPTLKEVMKGHFVACHLS